MTSNGRLVFVSHSGLWADAALSVVERLERLGVACWIAQRDIPVGDSWESRLVRAIRDSAAMVVLLNQDFQESQHCGAEVRIASESRIPFVVLRTDNAPLEGMFDYYLGGTQWSHLGDMSDDSLAETVRRLALQPLQRFGLTGAPADGELDSALGEAEHARQLGVEALASRLFGDIATAAGDSDTVSMRAQAVVGRVFAELQLGRPPDDETRAQLSEISRSEDLASLRAADQVKLRARLRLLGV